MRTNVPLIHLGLSCIVACSMSCVTEPRNKATTGVSSFTVAGFVPIANAPIQVQLWNNSTGQWMDWGSSTSSASTGQADCEGTTWHSFSTIVPTPRAASLYKASPQANRNAMDALVTIGPDRVPMPTFEANADSCAQQFCSGNQIISNCKSSFSPVLQLQVPCGGNLHACCHNSTAGCGNGFVCNSSFECRASTWLASEDYEPRNDAPTNRQQDWTEEVQGLATDGSSWYVVQAGEVVFGEFGIGQVVWKVPFNTGWGDFDGSQGFAFNFNCFHWGDPDVHQGVVYVPLEQCTDGQNKILALRASDMQPINLASTGTSNAAWVAVNPVDGRLYMGPTFDLVHKLKSFKITVNASSNTFTLTDPKDVQLYDRGSGFQWVTSPATRVQGGAFSDSGKLYLTEDDVGGAFGWIAGYHVGPKGAFRMVNIPIDVDFGTGEEVEGIEVHRTNSSLGDIHVMVLDNDWPDEDNAFVKHYKLTDSSKL